jgi:lipopolysaccharide/colanic/teichoic acid biosynthesis glycosyltransferase
VGELACPRPLHPPVVERSRRWAPLSRVVDVVVSSVALLALSPLLAAVAVAIRLDSPGPAIYRGERLGQGRRTFTVYKFRSMRVDADDEPHRRFVVGLLEGEPEGAADASVAFKVAADPRVTRLGAWLRRTSIDELPQLVNVLKGDMALVGPRPEVPYALEAYETWHHERFAVRPGLTGLWQVSGRGELSPRDMLALDVEYARRPSLWSDLRILARTPAVVLTARGAR